MKKYGLIIIGCLLAQVAVAQWDEVVVLTPDSFYNAWPQIVVDDSFHLHVFCPRGLNGYTAFPSSMFYLKFDSWGNLLSGPTELSPGNHYSDYTPGVLLDRNGIIHIVWSRTSDWPIPPKVIYARLNTNGEFLTPPTVFDTTYYIQNGTNLVQNVNGDIWMVGEAVMAAFHETGELFVPLQYIFPPESNAQAEMAVVSAAPDGKVFAALRYFSPGDTLCIAVTRLDTVVREATVILPGTPSSDPTYMGVAAFYIDSFGNWHSKLGRQDWGLFYQRNSVDGQVDTLNIDYYGSAGTYFRLVGLDTLVTFSDGLNVEPYHLLCGIHLNGTWAIHPTIISSQRFRLGFLYHFAWKAGSYWVPGLIMRPNGAHSIAMIHVPGPNEPPNAVDDRIPHSQPPAPGVAVRPNPAGNLLRLELSHVPNARGTVKLFNLLGQQVAAQDFESLSTPALTIPLPHNLPAGTYFGQIEAGAVKLEFSFIHL